MRARNNLAREISRKRSSSSRSNRPITLAPASRPDLQELVDVPDETLSAEYKSWLDLQGRLEDRANLARHIAAIANHGGGNIIFGFTDDLHYAGPNPFPHVKITRDLISSVVKKYLEPTLQCSVRVVRSLAGNDHPVMVVPPHGPTPICAKASGPNGKGITQGTYYTRKIGPESAPILTYSEWIPIIRRCAMHARSELVGDLYEVIRTSGLNIRKPGK